MEKKSFGGYSDELKGRRVKVIDPNYPNWFGKEFVLDGTREYTLKDGKVYKWYHLTREEYSPRVFYFGEHQIEFI